MHFLNLLKSAPKVTLGLNLVSKTMGFKDLIKIENQTISLKEAQQIAIFAPSATINIILNYEVADKFKVSFPETAQNIFHCLNPKCITNHEKVQTFFHLKRSKKEVLMSCKYCQKTFSRDSYD